MGLLFGGSGNVKQAPPVQSARPVPGPQPREAQAAAADERLRISMTHGRRRSILSYGQLGQQPQLLRKKLGE